MSEFGRGEKGAVAWWESRDEVCGRFLGIGPGDGRTLVRGGGVGMGRGRYIPCSARNLASNCSARWRPASCCSGVGGGDQSGGGGGEGLGAWS